MSLLDGLTILRYGHVYDGGGGMEQYLVDVNRALLERNAATIIQVQLTSDPARVGEAQETAGRGRLQRVSLFVDRASHEKAVSGSGHGSAGWERLKGWMRDRILFAPVIYPCLTQPALTRRRIPRRAGEPKGAGETVRALHRRFPLDLICLHTAGTADVGEILDVAQAEGIPTVYVHHFANERLSSFSMRRQLERIDGVAGVCGVDVPSFLQGRLRNVSDGIDTEFFRRSAASPLHRKFDHPVIFLGARITPTKGQADLVRAAGELRRRGLDVHVVLAGRTESAAFLAELQQLIQQEGLAERVELVGQLGTAELRDWYATATVVGFPTRHHEGLPRILMECQAMEVPAVVYASGGTSEGVKDGETGFLLKPGDFSGLVSRLEQLLRHESQRREMGQAARRLVEARFSLPALAERHEQFYRESMAAGG